MLVSIIIPVYNAEKFLDDCLQSIINQSYEEFEVICVNDGSIDNSKDICLKWAEKDSRINVVSKDNKGVSSARNLGLIKAKGDFICFVDADDTIHKDYLFMLINSVGNNDVALCGHTRLQASIGSGSKEISEIPTIDLVRNIVFERCQHPNLWCFLFSSKVIRIYNIMFSEDCYINEDYEFYMRFLILCKTNISIIPFRGYYYRPNYSSVSHQKKSERNMSSIEASRRIGELLTTLHIIKNNIVLSNGILSYSYFLAIEKNRDLYNLLHKRYNVNRAMKDMLQFPALKKRMVATCYICLGSRLFFSFISKNNKFIEIFRSYLRLSK